MIDSSNIQSLVGNHVAPYIYNSKEFIPGKTPISPWCIERFETYIFT